VAPAFRVKNTFIDDIVRDSKKEECEFVQRRARRQSTCPARILVAIVSEKARSDSGTEGEAGSSQEAMRERQPAMSSGSAGHGIPGNCKPCGWFWRQQGCGNGANCLHCHLCLPKDLKVRKKKALKAKQEQRRRSARDQERN